MLKHIFKLQKEFGEKFTPFGELSDFDKQVAVIDFLGHLQEEMIEFRREFPARKHWSGKRFNKVDEDRALDEFADMMAFFITIPLIMGWTPEKVFNYYVMKVSKNHERQQTGY